MQKGFLLVLLFVSSQLFAQQQALITGTVKSGKNQPLYLVNISVVGTSIGTTTNEEGHYELKVPAGVPVQLLYSYIGYASIRLSLNLKPGEERKINQLMNY